MTPSDIGFVTLVFSIGGVVGSLFAASLSDWLGRKRLTFVNVFFFLLGSILETAAISKNSLAFGRLVSGLGAGACIVNTPVLLNEIADDSVKGFLGSLNQVSVNIGILLTQILGIPWATDFYWRRILGVGAVLAALNIIALIFMKESPKWLVKKGRISEATATLKSLRKNPLDSDISYEIEQWVSELQGGALLPGTYVDTVKLVLVKEYLTLPVYRPLRVVATGLMTAQQFCGINAVVFYGVLIVATLFPTHAVILNCAISLVNVVVTYHSATVVDSRGRKPLLLTLVSVMGLSAFLVAFSTVLGLGSLSVLAIFLYIGAFAMGMGPIPFLLIAEVSQLCVTSMAQSYGTVMNWLATFVVGYFFPILNETIGGWVFALFGCVCVGTVVVVGRYLPETKGKKNYNEVWGTA